MPDARRVLLIAPFFPPRRRVGALRPMRFAIHLREHGWEPAVACLDAPGEALTAREAALLDGVPVLRLRPPLDRTAPRREAPAPAPSAPPRPRRPGAGALADAVDRAFPVDTWLPVLLARAGAVARFGRAHGAEIVWSTADPWSSHVLGDRVARRLGVPWVADFRDPWTLCTVRPEGRGRLARAWDRRVEAGVLRRADRVTFTAEATSALYRRAFPEAADRIRTVFNGYDAAFFDDPVGTDDPGPARAASPRPTLDVLFFGRFRPLSPALPAVEALGRLRAARPDLAEAVRVRSTGPLEGADLARAEALGVAACFEPVAPVPYEGSLRALRAADLLLLSTDPRRDEIIPAKLWDYLAAGRPIVSLAPNPEVGELLARAGAGVQLPADAPGVLADLLGGAAEAKRAGAPLPVPFAPDAHALADFDAPATTGALAEVLAECLSAPERGGTAGL